MIELTRLNGSLLVINSDLIKYAESSPDTMLTLINGEKIMVLESCQAVVERVIAYRARLLSEVTRLGATALDAASVAGAAAAARAQQNAGPAILPSPDQPMDDELKNALRRRRHDLA
jgi:flagellar protein FlbD